MSAALLGLLLTLLVGAPSARDEARIASLKDQVTAAYTRSAFLEADKLQRQLLDLTAKAYGKTGREYYDQLGRTAQAVSAASDFAGARRLYEEALVLAEALYGARSEQMASAMETLSAQHWILQDFDEAERLSLAALALREEVQGPTHPMTLVRLNLLGHLYMQRLDYGMSEHYFARALEGQVKASGPDDLQVAGLLFGIGWMHSQRGALGKAAEAFERAVSIYEKLKNPWLVSAQAAYSDTLGDVYERMGRGADAQRAWGQAETWYRANRDAAVAQYGPTHAVSLGGQRTLAQHLIKHGRFAEAREALVAAFKAEEKLYATNEAALLGALVSLGGLEEKAGDLVAARRYYTRAVKISEEKFGEAQAWGQRQMLIGLDEQEGHYKSAANDLRRMIAAYEGIYGPDHQMMSSLYLRLGLVFWAMGDVDAAVKQLARSEAGAERLLSVQLKTGTESDRQSVLDRFAYHMPVVVALDVAASGHPAATRLALTTVLRNKGRLLDAFTDSMGTLRRKLKPAHREILDALGAARARLATLAAKGPAAGEEAAFQRVVAQLEDEIRKRELQIGKVSAEYRAANPSVTLEAVQAAIPADAALVEIVEYTKPDPAKGSMRAAEGTPSYAAYVLSGGGPPQRVDLGPSAIIDALVPTLRDALASPASEDVKARARALDALVMEPVRGLLGETRRLLVAPDGALNLIPFAALVDERGRFLVERYELSYLSSGRDLLRLQVTVPTHGGPVIFADPSFAGAAPAAGAAGPGDPAAPGEVTPGGSLKPRTRGRRARALGAMSWSPLPGTRGEADALALVLPSAVVHLGSDATEEAMKLLAAPSILHVATHGFFLDSEETTGVGQSGRSLSENPLLRSGLALAGANKLESVTDDGVLTALEASGLDLWGTQLVVLSACETGVGEATAGQGVYGLRRALVMAGSESQLLSLWQVDDDATRDLMVGFYKQLLKGQERGQSLRSMQLRMLRDPDRTHPFYWASFIPAGAWGPLR